MLKNIFGKKSTGVVYIVCAALLLLFFAGALLAHFRAGGRSRPPSCSPMRCSPSLNLRS